MLNRHDGLCNVAQSHLDAFELRTGGRILQFATCSFDAGVWEIALAPDEHSLLSVSEIGEVRLWRIDAALAELKSWVQVNRYLRDLTCDERTLYRVEPLCTS